MKNIREILLLLSLGCAVIFLAKCKKDENTEEHIKEATTLKMMNDINADSLKLSVTWFQALGTRFALSENHKAVAGKIRNRFSCLGYTDVRIDSFLITKTYQTIYYQQWQYNVVATLTGSVYPDSVCIIGAHYDDNLKTGDPFSIVPGANDNGSGVAATLEIARVMKKNNFSPKNTIEFVAFGSEELGLYGGYAYAADCRQKLKKIMLMLNNDMIAFQKSTNVSDWKVNINDYDNSHTLRTEAGLLCAKYTSIGFINSNTYNKQTDSYPFFLNGYKALYFASVILDPNYHTLNDVVGNCNFDYCREIVKLNCALLVDKN